MLRSLVGSEMCIRDSHYTDKEALEFHTKKKPGKIEIVSSKNMTTKRDLALAYSPGVAVPAVSYTHLTLPTKA